MHKSPVVSELALLHHRLANGTRTDMKISSQPRCRERSMSYSSDQLDTPYFPFHEVTRPCTSARRQFPYDS
jgi:hypothetical protein